MVALRRQRRSLQDKMLRDLLLSRLLIRRTQIHQPQPHLKDLTVEPNQNRDNLDRADNRNLHSAIRANKVKRVKKAAEALRKYTQLGVNWPNNWKPARMINIETNMWAHCEAWLLLRMVEPSTPSLWLELGRMFMSMLTVKTNKSMEIHQNDQV